MKHHIIRGVIEEGIVSVEHGRSEEQHVDILTKALDHKDFRKAREIPTELPVIGEG